MGMHTGEIRKTCRKCKHKALKPIENSEFQTDWCKMGDLPCSGIKHCDVRANAWVRK